MNMHARSHANEHALSLTHTHKHTGGKCRKGGGGFIQEAAHGRECEREKLNVRPHARIESVASSKFRNNEKNSSASASFCAAVCRAGSRQRDGECSIGVLNTSSLVYTLQTASTAKSADSVSSRAQGCSRRIRGAGGVDEVGRQLRWRQLRLDAPHTHTL
jgi:hypothetical protein